VTVIEKLLHLISHLRGTNVGKVASWNEGGYICVGFECSTCGKIDPKSIEKLNESELLNGKYTNERCFDLGTHLR
jgi:hypothetical protein